MKSVYQTNATTILAERYLSGGLSTAWINGYCGPTSAHAMLRYLGFTDRSVSTHDMIILISTYTDRLVSVSELRNGMNQYLLDKGYNATVYSCNYNFNRVMQEINSSQPILMFTFGGGLTSGNHVQTIHGYKQTSDGNNITNTLIVNNSWGENGCYIPYTNSVPSYLGNHIYY